jgi:hypothetical protein
VEDAKSNPSTDNKDETMWSSTKMFLKTTIFLLFLINTLMLANFNVLGGAMALITKSYFGLRATYLWLAVIGFPPWGQQLVHGCCSASRRRLVACLAAVLIFSLVISTSSNTIPFFES